jgi:hypothetical protein
MWSKKLRMLRNRRGITLVDTLVAISITAVILLPTASMVVASLRCYNSELAKIDTDTSAVLALQKIVNDVREAKSVSMLSSGQQLRIIKPVVTADGYYDRSQPDSTHPIDYYLSGTSGTLGATGTNLWRAQNGALRLVKKGVNSLAFEYDTARSIKITVVTRQPVARGYRETELTQRVVYLRNY